MCLHVLTCANVRSLAGNLSPGGQRTKDIMLPREIQKITFLAMIVVTQTEHEQNSPETCHLCPGNCWLTKYEAT